MSELEADSLQVELMGERTGRSATLKIGGHDISKVTRSIDIHVPADGLVEADIRLVPTSILTKAGIEVESLKFVIDGIDNLVAQARVAAQHFDVMAMHGLADQLRIAADRVEHGI